MNVFQNIIYVLFFIITLRWLLTFVYFVFVMSDLERNLSTIKLDITDNILWIAPIVYFSGGFV